MSGETGVSNRGWIGTGSLALAVGTVQALAFWVAVRIGHPTWYVPVLVVSAVAIAVGSGRGPFGAGMAAFATGLLVAIVMPLGVFLLRQDPGLIAEKALDPAVHQVLYLTIYGPLVAAVLSLLFGVPLAYYLSRGFAGQALVESLVDLPLVVPHSVAGIVVLFSFGTGGIFPGLPILGQVAGMVLALLFVSAPFAVNSAREAFETIDRRLEYAARSHGASPFETFRRVTAPLAARGILTGGVLAWARGVSEFGAVAVVAYNVEFFYPGTFSVVTAKHAPVYIFEEYVGGSLASAGAVATLLLAVSAGLFVLVRWLGYERGRLL